MPNGQRVSNPLIQLIKNKNGATVMRHGLFRAHPASKPNRATARLKRTLSTCATATQHQAKSIPTSEAAVVRIALLRTGSSHTNESPQTLALKRLLGCGLTVGTLMSMLAAYELLTGDEADKDETWSPLKLQMAIGTHMEDTLNAAGKHCPELYDNVVNQRKRLQLAIDSGALPESAYTPPAPGLIGTTLTGRYCCAPDDPEYHHSHHRTLCKRIDDGVKYRTTPAFLAYRPGPLSTRNRTKFYAAISFDVRNGNHLKLGEDTEPPSWSQGCVSASFDYNYALNAYATSDCQEDMPIHRPLNDKQRQHFIEQLGGTFMISSTEDRDMGYNLARLTSKLPKDHPGKHIPGESEYIHLLATNLIGGLVDLVHVPGHKNPMKYVPAESLQINIEELDSDKQYAFSQSLVTLLQQSIFLDYASSDLDTAMTAAYANADPRALALQLISKHTVIADNTYVDLFFNNLVADDVTCGYQRSIEQQVRIYQQLQHNGELPSGAESLCAWLFEKMPSIQHFCKAREAGEQFNMKQQAHIAKYCHSSGLVKLIGKENASALMLHGFGLSSHCIKVAADECCSFDADNDHIATP